MRDHLEQARQRLAALRSGIAATLDPPVSTPVATGVEDTYREISEKSEISPAPLVLTPEQAYEALHRLAVGLTDAAVAAREQGDQAKYERLIAEQVAVIAGPYAEARAALRDQPRPQPDSLTRWHLAHPELFCRVCGVYLLGGESIIGACRPCEEHAMRGTPSRGAPIGQAVCRGCPALLALPQRARGLCSQCAERAAAW